MGIVLMAFLLVASARGEDVAKTNHVVGASDVNDDISGTELKLVFTIFRHGDRTPDQDEMDLYPAQEKLSSNIFFPYGMKALTNKGKQRGFSIGKYLRKRYDGFISPLYLTDEITIRTTAYARTKMTALTALAALYPPPPAQKWNPTLNWQPVPYDTLDIGKDNLMYWYNCPLYIKLRNDVYREPEVAKWIEPYKDLFQYIQKFTGNNITNPEQVFFLDNLFQTLSNVGVNPPDWAQKVMPQIKEVTKLEYATEFYSSIMIKLATGVLLDEILNATSSFVEGDTEQPKMQLYSAHENNVAALMAACKVFEPHQPNYGATFGLELRQGKSDKRYSVWAVYAKNAGGPGEYLPIKGCGSGPCDYDKFVNLVRDNAWSLSDFYNECKIEDI